MKLIFTQHARDQMAERGIDEADVRSVLSNPFASVPGTAPDAATIRYVGYVGVGARAMSVVTEAPGIAVDPVKVVTVYWE